MEFKVRFLLLHVKLGTLAGDLCCQEDLGLLVHLAQSLVNHNSAPTLMLAKRHRMLPAVRYVAAECAGTLGTLAAIRQYTILPKPT